MKKLGLAGALVLVVAAVLVAGLSVYKTVAGPKQDPNRFPKPSPEVLARLKSMQNANTGQSK